jgi:hypothetical protein
MFHRVFFISCRTPKRMHPDQRGRALDAGLGLWRGVGMKTGRLIGVVMPRLVRGRKSHGSAAAFTGDLLQIHPQRKSQSQPHEESAEHKLTSCCSWDFAIHTGYPVIFTGKLALCGITRSVPDVQSLPGLTQSKGQLWLTSDMPSLFHSPRTMSACTPTSEGERRSRGWCCSYGKSSKQGGW